MTPAQAHLFKTRLAEQNKTHPGYAAKFRKLSRLMVAAGGGDQAVPHLEPEAQIDALLKNGKLLQPAAVVMRRGNPSDCHRNAAMLFRAGKGVIATGYALDPLAAALLGGGQEGPRDRDHRAARGVLRHRVRRDRLWAPS